MVSRDSGTTDRTSRQDGFESASQLLAVTVDDVERVAVGSGCSRRTLPGSAGLSVWVVDIAAGQQWPYIDVHEDGPEAYYVVEGEVIEGDQRFGPGTYLWFPRGTSHRPRTDTGVRLFGVNPRG